MIETEVSRAGQSVLKKNGRLLASAFQPLQEASAWTEKVCLGLAPGEPIIVLGIGSGYHVASLLASYPRNEVLVIENDAELARSALALHPSIPANRVLVQANWLQLIDDQRFLDAIGGVYRIAPYGPSAQIEPEFFGAVDRLLRGRDRLSFLVLLKTRPEFLPLLSSEAVGKLGDEGISIKIIRQLFAPQAVSSRERRLWKVLEELVL